MLLHNGIWHGQVGAQNGDGARELREQGSERYMSIYKARERPRITPAKFILLAGGRPLNNDIARCACPSPSDWWHTQCTWLVPGLKCSSLRATQRYFWKHGAARVGNRYPSHTAHRTLIFIFLYWDCNGRANFWPLQKFRNSHVFSLRIFIPEKGLLSAAIQNDSTKIVRNDVFFNALPKTKQSKNFVLACSVLCLRNCMWTQKDIVFDMGWTWVAGSKWDFSEGKSDSHNYWKFNAMFFPRYPKRHHLQMFGRAVPEAWPKSPFSGVKIMEYCTWLVFWVFVTAKSWFNHQTNHRKYKKPSSLCRVKKVDTPDRSALALRLFVSSELPLTGRLWSSLFLLE